MIPVATVLVAAFRSGSVLRSGFLLESDVAARFHAGDRAYGSAHMEHTEQSFTCARLRSSVGIATPKEITADRFPCVTT